MMEYQMVCQKVGNPFAAGHDSFLPRRVYSAGHRTEPRELRHLGYSATLVLWTSRTTRESCEWVSPAMIAYVCNQG